MHKNYLKVITLAFLVLGATAQAQAQSANAPYPVMAPLDQYLIPDEKSEITLARTAAPSSVSDEAEVMVLGRSGYKTDVKGTNGFLCIVRAILGRRYRFSGLLESQGPLPYLL